MVRLFVAALLASSFVPVQPLISQLLAGAAPPRLMTSPATYCPALQPVELAGLAVGSLPCPVWDKDSGVAGGRHDDLGVGDACRVRFAGMVKLLAAAVLASLLVPVQPLISQPLAGTAPLRLMASPATNCPASQPAEFVGSATGLLPWPCGSASALRSRWAARRSRAGSHLPCASRSPAWSGVRWRSCWRHCRPPCSLISRSPSGSAAEADGPRLYRVLACSAAREFVGSA